MKRELVLGTLVALGGLTLTAAAMQQPPQQPPQKMVVEVQKIKDNLFMLRGGGGNTTVFVHSDGVTVVDTKLPGWGQPLLARIKEVTDKPVVRIINTHTHGDHVSGNVEFADNVDVVTHVNTAENMKEMRPLRPTPNPVNIFKDNNGKGLPKRTFKDTMTIGSGADRVELHYFGRGHTNGDAWVLFPAARVLAAGDIFLGKQLPIIDPGNGGSGVELPDSLMKAYTFASKTTDQIVTGHSTVMTPNDLRDFTEFNRDFLEYVRTGKKAGKTAEQMAKEWTMPTKYQGFGAPQPAALQGNIDLIAKEIN